MIDLFTTIHDFFFGPPLQVEPETPRVVFVPVPLPPAPPPPPVRYKLPIDTPPFQRGFSRIKIGNWPTKALANWNAGALREEIQFHLPFADKWPKAILSGWTVSVVVVPDVHGWTIVLHDVDGIVAAGWFCEWLKTDFGPYGAYTDGLPWTAWPAWVNRAPGRECSYLDQGPGLGTTDMFLDRVQSFWKQAHTQMQEGRPGWLSVEDRQKALTGR